MTTEISRKSWEWLLLEGIAIVFSILLAFWINAWWQGHTDRVRTDEYLSQLRSDSLENQVRLEEALLIEKGQQRAMQEILAALRTSGSMTIESARAWTQMQPGFIWYSDPRLLDGTIRALVATGDINLVGDPNLKTALIKYLIQLTDDLNEFHRGVDRFLLHHDELLRLFELARQPGVDPGEEALARELLSMQGDRNAAVIFRLLEKNTSSRIWYLEQMLAATNDLNHLLAGPAAAPAYGSAN